MPLQDLTYTGGTKEQQAPLPGIPVEKRWNFGDANSVATIVTNNALLNIAPATFYVVADDAYASDLTATPNALGKPYRTLQAAVSAGALTSSPFEVVALGPPGQDFGELAMEDVQCRIILPPFSTVHNLSIIGNSVVWVECPHLFVEVGEGESCVVDTWDIWFSGSVEVNSHANALGAT